MVRPLRKLVPDGWYHVFGRGWERRRIFADDSDRLHFLDLLEGLTDQYGFRVHAFVLMTNHWHGIVQTPHANLSQGMQWFNTSYSAWFNARHGRVGSLWQGRYRDVLIEDGAWAHELSFYVHLNPLRLARLGLDKRGRMMEGKGYREPTREQATERLKALREYRWSSYRGYAGYCAPPSWLTTQGLWGRTHVDPGRQPEHYRLALKERLTQGVAPERAERLRDVVAIGSAAFSRRIRESVGPDIEITNRRDMRARVSEKQIRDAVVGLRGEPWSAFCERRGDWGRHLYLWAMKRFSGSTLREAGHHAGAMKPSAVDMAIKRWEGLIARDPHMRALRDELIEQLSGL